MVVQVLVNDVVSDRGLVEEAPESASDPLEIEKESVVAPHTAELVVRDLIISGHFEGVRELALLFDGEEDVGLDTEYEGGYILQPLQSLSELRKVGGFGSGYEPLLLLSALFCCRGMFAGPLLVLPGRASPGCANSGGIVREWEGGNSGRVGISCRPRLRQAGQSRRSHVEQIHRFRKIDHRVGVVGETEPLPLVIEVCLDQEVGTEPRDGWVGIAFAVLF